MSALIRQVAVVSITDQVPIAMVMQISAALQKQATRDLAPIWSISATVDAFEQLSQVPVGTWPIIIGGKVPPGAGGFHTDSNGQPLALVRASDDIDKLCQTCSHEMIEMLVDPFGSRFVPGDSPMADQGRVNFLLEACDPSEGPQFGYSVNNLLVSDFYTPNYFDPVQSSGVRYSFTGAITEPRQVLLGGYLSWQEPISKHFFQERKIDTVEPDFEDLGIPTDSNLTPREFIDRATDTFTQSAMASGRKVAMMASTLPPDKHDRARVSQAKAWEILVGEILDGTSGSGPAERSDSNARLRRPPRAPK
ncbi:hypothetical protein HFN49_00040 [Rhizobium leguminosarum]|uniref:hypothetical protein n=1 Tax=Rhizobium ruizarguesonis TaxID=2081791 RepID=UPI001A992FBC|nr:hypothetical protein [Rhizobium ruizarguesonis]MBY5884590.1 hypothetical protein [Rhizobium leguminosarum]QSZ05154.1 hypothetical protein J3P73_31600 [Rhizobium ruizarguesonis]